MNVTFPLQDTVKLLHNTDFKHNYRSTAQESFDPRFVPRLPVYKVCQACLQAFLCQFCNFLQIPFIKRSTKVAEQPGILQNASASRFCMQNCLPNPLLTTCAISTYKTQMQLLQKLFDYRSHNNVGRFFNRVAPLSGRHYRLYLRYVTSFALCIAHVMTVGPKIVIY